MFACKIHVGNLFNHLCRHVNGPLVCVKWQFKSLLTPQFAGKLKDRNACKWYVVNSTCLKPGRCMESLLSALCEQQSKNKIPEIIKIIMSETL
jgi:hypothetical protein